MTSDSVRNALEKRVAETDEVDATPEDVRRVEDQTDGATELGTEGARNQVYQQKGVIFELMIYVEHMVSKVCFFRCYVIDKSKKN